MTEEQDFGSDHDINARADQVEAIMLKLEEILDLDVPNQNRLHQCIDAISNLYIGGSIDKGWEVLQPLDRQVDIELLDHQFKLDPGNDAH